jgi:hypothetical protein
VSTFADSFEDYRSSMYMNPSPGENVLGSMHKGICSQANITLIFTKQYLRATNITVSDINTCVSINSMDVNPKTPLKNNKRKREKPAFMK